MSITELVKFRNLKRADVKEYITSVDECVKHAVTAHAYAEWVRPVPNADFMIVSIWNRVSGQKPWSLRPLAVLMDVSRFTAMLDSSSWDAFLSGSGLDRSAYPDVRSFLLGSNGKGPDCYGRLAGIIAHS